MKMLLVMFGAAALTACSSTASVARIDQPGGTNGLMLTNVASDKVAACFGRTLNIAPANIPNGFSVAAAEPATANYQILAISDPLARYTTRVDVYGHSDSSTEGKLALCLLPDPGA